MTTRQYKKVTVRQSQDAVGIETRDPSLSLIERISGDEKYNNYYYYNYNFLDSGYWQVLYKHLIFTWTLSCSCHYSHYFLNSKSECCVADSLTHAVHGAGSPYSILVHGAEDFLEDIMLGWVEKSVEWVRKDGVEERAQIKAGSAVSTLKWNPPLNNLM